MSTNFAPQVAPTGIEQQLFLRGGMWVVRDATGEREFSRHQDAKAWKSEMERHLRFRLIPGGRS